MTKPVGLCRLCGELKKLTPEHMPPKAAFNKKPRSFETIQDVLGLSGRKYSIFRGGIQKTTLCKKCNNNTGKWYAVAFIEWTKQGLRHLNKIDGNSNLYRPFQIMPLNVLKQIIVMNLATIPESRIQHYQGLRQFVLNRQDRHFPSNYRIFTYFTRNDSPRLSDRELVVTRIDIGATEYVNFEIALPPFGYCVTSTTNQGHKSLAELQGLFEITAFAQFNYNSEEEVWLSLPVLETHEPFALDYRTEAEVLEHRAKNRL